MALPRLLPTALAPLARGLARPGCGRALQRAASASAQAAPGEKGAFVLSPLPPPGCGCLSFFPGTQVRVVCTLVINCFPWITF